MTGGGLQARAIRPLIGSEIVLPKAALLSGEHAAELRALLEDRVVLVFPQAQLSADEQVAFTRTLGTHQPDRADGGTTTISIDPEGGASANLTRGAFFWHFDGYMNPVPIRASILCCEAPADEGGDTAFANTAAAWEALDAGMKARIAPLRCLHALAQAQRAVEPEPSLATLRQWLAVPSAELPLVWSHNSGRKSLVIGNSAAGIVGMDPLASLELLVTLRDFATQDRFTLRHRWQAGDMVIWDNTQTLHRALPYAPGSGRRMRRTKLAGEEPIA